MDATIATAWVSAMRAAGGDDLPTLRNGAVKGAFGILVDLYLVEHPDAAWVDDTFAHRGSHHRVTVPLLVVEWAGFSERSLRKADDFAGRVSGNLTLARIATFVENNHERL